MSDSLPRFQPGDRVRVMQTPEMEAREAAEAAKDGKPKPE